MPASRGEVSPTPRVGSQSPAGEDDLGSKELTEEFHNGCDVSGSTILVVDDSHANLRLLTNILAEAGFKVRPADSGDIALESVETGLPDLILLDIRMPAMDGLEVCRRLKADRSTGDIPVVFISALADTAEKISAFEAGGVDYVTKPFKKHEVLARVHTHLSLSRMKKNLEQRVSERTTELEKANRELDRRNRELHDLLHAASHDLRAPLVSLRGFADIVASRCDEAQKTLATIRSGKSLRAALAPLLGEEIPEALEYIQTGSAKMFALLKGLLDLSRLENATLAIERLDLNAMVAEVVRSVKFTAEQAGVTVEVDNLPPCRGDRTQVYQVFLNLVDNALKHLDPERPGHIRVSARTEQNQVVYCVEDNGVGIAPEDRERVFSLFHRLDPERGAGHGLGLTIVRRILDRHGAEIRLESTPGRGSKFFVSLPAG